MAIRTIRNTTTNDIFLIDFGNQLIKATGDINGDDLLQLVNRELIIKNSSQMFTLISDGSLIVLDANNNDIIDPLEGWKYLTDERKELIDAASGKVAVQESSRPIVDGKLFNTVWSGAGDDMTVPTIGGGPLLLVQTQVGVPKVSQDIEFHPNFGDVYLHEGYVMWQNAGWGDCIDVEVIAKPTPLQTVSALDYELVNVTTGVNKIIAASGGPGTGTHGLNGTPVFVPNETQTGYWNLINGVPSFSSTQTGLYDWYDVEIPVNRFINRVPLFGTSSNYIMLQSADSVLMPPGYVLRITTFNNSDTIWKAWMFMTIYREKTV